MQVRLTFVDLSGDRRPRDVLVEAPPGTEARQLQALPGVSEALSEALSRTLSEELGAAAMFVGGMPLPNDARVGVPPLVDGAVVTSGGAGMVAKGLVPGLLELHVTEGPDCGQVFRLPPGRRRIGRATEAAIRVDDPDLSRAHAELDVGNNGVSIRDLGSSNGTLVDGIGLGDVSVPLPIGARLVAGSSTFVVRLPTGAPAALSAEQGALRVNRSPRTVAPTERPELHLPSPPQARQRPRVPVLASLIPLALALVLLRITGSPTMLLFALMSPLMLLGNLVGDRRAGRRSGAAGQVAFDEALTQTLDETASALLREAAHRRAELPDRAELLLTVERPGHRLWQRRRKDDDFLTVRVGTRDLTSRVVVIDSDGGRASPDVEDVPVPVRLAELGVVGVCGPREPVLGVVRGLLADVCGWHSPLDVSLVVLAASSELGAEWSWTAYLPHNRPRLGEPCLNLVGIDTPNGAQLTQRVAELTRLLEHREQAPVTGDGAPCRAATVVLLDGAQRLRTVPGMVPLLERGPSVGLYFLCLDERPAQLPVETGGTIHLVNGVRATMSVTDSAPLPGILADRVSARWAERFARALAPLRDATPDDAASLPDSARLSDIIRSDDRDATLESKPPNAAFSPDGLTDRWRRHPRSTRAVLGLARDGPYAVDLATDGPHLLVGGTTGSGKSELLQTLIASLALVNRPDQLCFVLVDYKGGSAFRECAGLPHTVGLVTDLDSHLTRRALASLTAELRRRERLLGRIGAKDLDDYQATATADEPTIPRLVLVIDEFRMLAEELPGFVDGLVRIAALGRSLGVHLVLATQRPAGIISADIKANVNLRIALRVRDRVDSDDVVEAPDAAAISALTPGRAVARSGAGALATFQTGQVSGSGNAARAERLSVRPLIWGRLGDPPDPLDPPERPGAGTTGTTGTTDASDHPDAADRSEEAHSGSSSAPDADQQALLPPLSLPGTTDLTDLARIAASCHAASRRLGCTPPASPWLPPLPSVVLAQDLRASSDGPVEGVQRIGGVPIGLIDLPGEQEQRQLSWDIERDGHLAVAGMARTGRTTLLRTLAGMISSLPSSEVHLYGIDGSSGALGALSALPHTGAVVHRSEPARLDRLIQRLSREVDVRQADLAAQGFGSLAEQRSAARAGRTPALPYLVVLIDGWEGMVQALEGIDHGRPLDTLLQALRDGVGAGLRAVITGDRSVLLSKVASLVSQTLVLELADPTDLMLAGISPRQVPAQMPPGRAVRVSDGAEVQLAVLSADLTGPGQLAALAARGERARRQWSGERLHAPFRVEPLPVRVTFGELLRACDGEPVGWALVGVGGDDLRPVGIDLSSPGTTALIAGPPRSGRSSTLATMARSLAARGTPVAIIAAGRSPLTALADHPGVLGLVSAQAPNQLAAWVAARPGLVVLADDAERLLDTQVEAILLELLQSPEQTALSLVCSGSSSGLGSMFRGLTVAARQQRLGVLLNPTTFSDGDLFGLRLGRQAQQVPGRGLLVDRAGALPVQVAISS